MIDVFVKSFPAPRREIISDIACRRPARLRQDTDDPVRGQRELAWFNPHTEALRRVCGTTGHCFQPTLSCEGITGKPVAALPWPVERPSGKEATKVPRHVIGRIRRHWRKVRILVRHAKGVLSARRDRHSRGAPVLDLLVANLLAAKRCDFMLGLAVNPVLKPMAAPWRLRCKQCDQRRAAGRPTNFACSRTWAPPGCRTRGAGRRRSPRPDMEP
jgi:hypothetical protein